MKTQLQLVWLATFLSTLGGCAVAAGNPQGSGLNVAGAPAYQYNEPFLAWPQAGGDMVCATEDGPCTRAAVPTIDPSLAGRGTPLRIDHIRVAVGDPGRHEQNLGDLVFPSGMHTRTDFSIANGKDGTYKVIAPRVEFRSLEPGAPPFTEFAMDRPAFQGLEHVMAVLVWDTESADRGAYMEIANLVVE